MTDFQALWEKVEAVPHPGDAPKPNLVWSVSLSRGVRLLQCLLFARGAALGLAWGGLALLLVQIFLPPEPSDVRWMLVALIIFAVYCVQINCADVSKFQDRLRIAETTWKHTEREWNWRAGPRQFEMKLFDLYGIRNDWRDLPNIRAQMIEELKEKRRYSMMQQFLTRFPIEETREYHVAMNNHVDLPRMGIRTAADVTYDSIKGIPTIGDLIGDELLQWRCSCEAEFGPNPNDTIDPSEIERIDGKIRAKDWELVLRLKKSLPELHQALNGIEGVRARGMDEFKGRYYAYRKAQSDLEALIGAKAVRRFSQPESEVAEPEWRSLAERCKNLLQAVLSSVLRL